MSNVRIGLIILSGVAFVLAAIGSLASLNIAGISPEAFSRASNNLALLAIALAVCIKRDHLGA